MNNIPNQPLVGQASAKALRTLFERLAALPDSERVIGEKIWSAHLIDAAEATTKRLDQADAAVGKNDVAALLAMSEGGPPPESLSRQAQKKANHELADKLESYRG